MANYISAYTGPQIDTAVGGQYTTVNTATLSVTGTSFQNRVQGNTSVNTATLTVTGTAYANLIQANTDARVTGNVLIGKITNAIGSKLNANGTISETVSNTEYLVASQYDVGTDPNQVPLNQFLGNLAFMSFVPLVGNGTSAPTLASAGTIEPTTAVSFVSGTTAISTITIPYSFVGSGQITLIPTGLFTTNTAGNIALATTAVVNKALILTYDDVTAKWYPSY